jgi:diguanylate cyclase (GGDEF)-like protein/PAS domain S-box-containing protein
MRAMLQQLSDYARDKLLTDLDMALEHHSAWLANVNRGLVCGMPAEASDINDCPHTCCRLGRWYYAIDDPLVIRMEPYLEMGRAHRELHAMARQILLDVTAGRPVASTDYDRFTSESANMRHAAQQLKNEMRNSLQLSSRVLGKIFENANEAVMITDPESTILNVNPAFSRITGYSANDVIGETPRILQSGRQDQDFYHGMWRRLKDNDNWHGEIWNRRKDGREYLEEISICAIRNADDQLTHYMGIFSDITSEREKAHRLHHLAHFDQLTGLSNRMQFGGKLRRAVAKRKADRKLALLYIDLDGFKKINDQFGHAFGDELLASASQRITSVCPEPESVGRQGGDEFTLFMADLDRTESALAVAERIIAVLSEPFCMESGECCELSASVGVSLCPAHGVDADLLLKQADIAMYQAKQSGKRRVRLFQADMLPAGDH